MSVYLHPGVYVQELPAAVRPIQGVGTSTAGFVGVADKGPIPGFTMPGFAPAPVPPLVTSFAQYTRLFGGYRTDSYLTYAVQTFFDNGGSSAYIVRIAALGSGATGSPPSPGAVAALAGLGLASMKAGAAALGVIASSPGAWANGIGVQISDATHQSGNPSLFKLTLLQAGLPLESYDDVSVDPSSPTFVETVVNSSSQNILVKVADAQAAASDPVTARPKNTAGVELGPAGSTFLTVNAPQYFGGALTITTTAHAGLRGQPPTFDLNVVQGGQTLETFPGLMLDRASGNFAERRINGISAYITVTAPDHSATPVDFSKTFDRTPAPTVIAPATGPGYDGTTPPQGDLAYVGNADNGTGLHAFDAVTDVDVIAIPGGGNNLIASAGMAYCKNRPLQDAFFVADVGVLDPATARTPSALPTPGTKATAATFVTTLSTPNDYGAVYYPWLRVADPIGQGVNPTIALPPSGFICGLYARIDGSRGVFKSPAGTETALADALTACDTISDTDQDVLNPIGLNALRQQPSAGIVAWGARTLSPDPAWRYISVRRTAIFLRASIYHGIQWAVFEPNDEPLWADLRLNIRAFMLTQFRAGAFQGGTPDDAFFVTCDSTTTTQEDIDNGVVNILVGFAPLKPAEFVVLKLSQKLNQAS